MKASAQLLIGSLALATMLSASAAQGAPHGVAAWTIATDATGQFGASAGPRREADDLLRQARKAMKDGDFALAETLIGKAEKLNVQYDALTERFYDTPAKLRKVLDEEKSKNGGNRSSGAQLPSARFPALLGGGEPQPQAIPASPFPAPSREQVVNQLTDDSGAKARNHLKEARAALAAGNKPAAVAAYQKVLAIPAQYAPGEDSPERLAADMARAGIDLSQVAAAPGMTSPFMLRPSDIDPASQRLPIDERAPQMAPAMANPAQNSPYAMPSGPSNPLDPAATRVGGGSFQPAGAAVEPQRLPTPEVPTKDEAQRLMAQARFALDKGDLRSAKLFAEQASAMNIPQQAYGPGETQPWQVLLDIDRAIQQRGGVQLATAEVPVDAAPGSPYPVTQGMYNPTQDPSRTVQASSTAAMLNRQGGSPGQTLYEEGLAALQAQDRETALAKFTEAWRFEAQLDPETRQQLKDKMVFLRAAANAQPLPALEGQPSPLEQVNSQQDLLRQKLYREITSEMKTAEQLAASEPRTALENLNKLRTRVASADIEPAALKQLLTLVDRNISELTIYIEQNESTISNDERNSSIRADLVRSEQLKLQTQDKLAQLVEQFNQLMEEQRFPEAEVIAKQGREIAPNEPVVVNMVEKSKLARNLYESMRNNELKAEGVLGALGSVEESSRPFDDRNPIVFGDVRRWSELTRSRRSLLEQRSKLSPAELEIQRSLGKMVEARFENRPLSEVLDTLGKMSGVNVYLDPQGLHAEGVTSDTPVTLSLQQPISLKSALNLLLEPHGLSYVIQNEVLRITSAQTRNSNVYPQTYYVADLVIPIPNFVPSYNMGLPGAIRESLNSLGYGAPVRAVSSGPLTLAQNEAEKMNQPANASVLAQMAAGNMLPSGGQRGPQSLGGGPGGLGGGVQADFDTLIELITSTIAPTTWDEVGGPGSIQGFDTNLSLVVSQTQEVHEQIADLLDQLRRLQDLQVTIEVRFITLSDRFFERIGIDFDFNIDDNTGLNNVTDQLPTANQPGQGQFDDNSPSLNFGLNPTTGLPAADLDLGFRQGSFGSAVPQFGGFDAGTAASFGFAILSDIEVFFLLNAAQGDDRTNILQAPKVTLFNGQQAFVSDTSQRPFVISVIPVVGDFAAAQQPVIAVLNEGTSLSVQAVVSSDRRFVRLTMVPFFSTIGDVDTFTFTGSTTTNTGTNVQDPSNPDDTVVDNEQTTTEGTTVQLPTFAFTTVTTTVSVPDGGTVLLGGIKRLREGRNERGVPLLSKVPYVSRLFKNVGIGREAQSLMMMVTPRIIIQEEEEEKLGIELPQ